MAIILRTTYDKGEVNEGETRLLAFLEKHLPETYLVVPNVELPHTNPRNRVVEVLEYDCIVVAPHALYHLENKHWQGYLTGDDREWYLNGRPKGNPLRTCAYKTKVLASKLKEKDGAWGRPWVASGITLSHPSMVSMQLEGDSADVAFTLDKGLTEYLQDPDRARSFAGKISDLQEPISRYLTAQQAPAQRKPRLFEGEYEPVEVLYKTDSRTDYLVKPRGIQTNIFRKVAEYAVSLAYLDTTAREQRLRAIKNQYIALRKMAGSPYILHVEFRSDDEQGFFYEITDYLEESSLRRELHRRTQTFQDRLTLLRHVALGLKVAHASGVYHRDVCPDNIFVGADSTAFLANFGKSYFTDADRQGHTVFPTLRDEELSVYMPWEMSRPHEADARTDVYGWGITAYETLVGHLPQYADGTAFAHWGDLDHHQGRLQATQLPQAVQPELPAWTNELIDRCLRHNPEDRFGSMEELLTFIENARRTPENGPTSRQNQVLEANQTAEQNAAYSNRDSEDLRQGDRAGDCLLINKIEKGGYSEVWRAKHTIQGRDYAMKVFFPSVQFDNVLVEFDVLNDLSHPNVVKFIYNGRLANGRYYTLMELLEGDNLRKYVFGNPPLRLTYPNVYRAGQEICAALTYLHSKGFIHRDIKPHNIIWNRQERFVLIDFNVAGTEANTDRAGTDAYAPPDKLEGNRRTRWDASCDTFALGVTLYELVCHKHPYRSGIPTLTNAPEHPRSYNSDVSDEFAAFLLKAVQPRTADRFETAADMLTALKDIGIGGLLHPVKPPEPTPVSTEAYVDALNKLFSQSRYNNAGTRASTVRGLDSFARDTYIETRLDTRLKQAILAGTFRLVIITGNAGDGKTAFIQRLEDELRADSRAMMAALPTQNGASFQIGGIPFRSNYDGSQDEAGQDNNTVLDEFFRPFVGLTDVSQAKEGRLVGINEGRLVEYLQSRRAELGYLAETVEGFFYNENTTELPAGLLIINLNVRAVVGSPADTEPSLFRKQVGAFVRPDHWQGCANCAVSEACFIRFNAQSMNDPVAGSEVISRMESLVRTVHFRRDLHITMRDMRSLLAFWITRDHSCADVQQMVAQSPETVTWLSKHYYNLTAPQKDRGNQDRLVEKLRRLDVGRSVVPALDRALFFSPLAARNYLDYGTREGNLLDALNQLQATSGTGLADNERQAAIRRVQQLLARHQYFEGRFAQPYKPDSSKDSKDSSQTEETLRRYEGEAVRNPYRSVNAFSEMVSLTRIFSGQQAQEATERAMRSIAVAIARLENCHNTDLAAKYIVQAAGRPDPLSASYRLFPLTDFELVEDRRPSLSDYMEYVPDRLIFRHRDPDNRHIALTISLDLYEMLYYIQQGYAPSLNDLKGRFVEYSVFRNMLANLPYRKVVVTGSGYNPGSSIENYVTIEADNQNRLIIHVEELS